MFHEVIFLLIFFLIFKEWVHLILERLINLFLISVDPGGWVPVAGLRMIYKREYPKFLRGFTEYVVKNTRSTPLIL